MCIIITHVSIILLFMMLFLFDYQNWICASFCPKQVKLLAIRRCYWPKIPVKSCFNICVIVKCDFVDVSMIQGMSGIYFLLHHYFIDNLHRYLFVDFYYYRWFRNTTSLQRYPIVSFILGDVPRSSLIWYAKTGRWTNSAKNDGQLCNTMLFWESVTTDLCWKTKKGRFKRKMS